MATYVTSDLHGMGAIWDKIKAKITSEDTLYILGDMIDRGPDGLRILEEAIDMPNIKFCLGNHEEFFIQYAEKLVKGELKYPDKKLWEINGGEPTMKSIIDKYTYRVDQLEELINKMFYKFDYSKIFKAGDRIYYLNHSGCIDKDAMPDDYIWNRTHFTDDWDREENAKIIHGHTPVLNAINEITNLRVAKLEKEGRIKDADQMRSQGILAVKEFIAKPKILKYCDGHKIDLDLCCFQTGVAALIKLEDESVEYIHV